jgi:hypothetical protein
MPLVRILKQKEVMMGKEGEPYGFEKGLQRSTKF